jgi:hypothetical protein
MAEVSIERSVPFTVIEFSLSSSIAPPLNLPKAFASTTVPRAAAPAGITVLPSTVTADASVALKESPGELSFDPTEFPSLTVNVVPAGTTTGCGSGAGVAAGVEAGELIAFPPAAFDGAAAFWPPELDAVSAGLLEQATSVNNRKMDITYSARERMIFPPKSKMVEAKTVIQPGKVCKRRGGRFSGMIRHSVAASVLTLSVH